MFTRPLICRYLMSMNLNAKCLLTGMIVMAAAGCVLGQTLYFTTNVPSNWRAASGSLVISTNHYKCPANNPLQCLQWNYGANDTLTVTNPGIPSALVQNYYTNTCDLWIYNPAPLPGQKLKFQFVDATGTVQYYFYFYLNYSGWREATRSYRYDMSGLAANNNFAKVSIIGPTNFSGQLYFDTVNWVDSNITRNKDLQNLDVAGSSSATNYYHEYYEMTPDIPTNAPTPAELSDLAAARAAWLADNAGSAPSGSSISSADASWTNLNIVVNGTNIMGQVILENTTADSYYSWLQILSQDVYWNGSADSANKMNLFLQNWWDQGMDFNSGATQAGGSGGYSFRTVPSAFVLAYPGYDAPTKQHVWQMLYWMNRVGHYWSTNWVAGMTASGADDYTYTDDIYVNTRRELGAILFLTPDDMTAIQYLKGYKRYLERFLNAVNGTDDGLKADGCGFHHWGHYNHYMYAFNELTSVLNDLTGTQFEINSNAYLNLRGALLAQLRMGNAPDATNPSGVGFAASSLSGRYPLQNTLTPSSSTLQTLGTMGGSILGLPVDPLVAQVYDRILGASYPYTPFIPYGSESNPEGFYQFNYSPIGIYRQTNWVACMHGMNNDFWGTEIAISQNVYGRYQSYGSLEILYPGGFASSGWNLSGWDWNKPPGATTIVLPWSKLIYDNATSAYMERDLSATNFAGALAFHSQGNNIQGGIYGGFGGLYACNFRESSSGANHNGSFAWRKSWFCFTNQIICLGSNITNNDAADPTITTLFQAQLTNTTVPTVMSGTNISAFPNSQTNNGTLASWLLDGYGTGYFVRPGAVIRVDRTAQISPDNSGSGVYSTNDYATAWLNHGTAPTNASYEYVAIPNTTSNAMAQWAVNYTNSANTPYTVLECDGTAHVVQWKPDGRIGYALFATNTPAAAVTNAGPLRSVSQPCLAMTQPLNSALWLTVVNPDLNIINDVSTLTNVDVKLAGNWLLASGPTNATVLSSTVNTTVLRMQTVNGFPVEVLLLAISNSLTAPMSLTATVISTNQINLAWSPVTNATGYLLQRGGVTLAALAGTNYTDTGLSVGTTYVYTVVSTNANGLSPVSMPATATTSTPGSTPLAGATLYWDADIATTGDQDGNGVWNTAAINWLNGGGNVNWVDNCSPVFGASLTTNCTVTVGANVAPAGITVNTGSSYAFVGNNSISTANNLNITANGYATISAIITGSKGLTNIGSGTLNLSGTNTYTGGTAVSAGTVNVSGDQSAATGGWNMTSGVGSANFNAGSQIAVASGKTITLGGNSSTGNTLTVAGIVSNSGTLTVSRRANLNLNGPANWVQGGTMSVLPAPNTGYPADMTVGTGATFTYTGSGMVGVSPCSGNSGSGVLTLAGGTFVTGQGFVNNTASSTGVGTIAFNNNGTLRLTTNIANFYASAGSANSITLGMGGGTIDTSAYATTINNVITGSGTLTKLGAGTLALSASNSFTGGITVSNGVLQVDGYSGSGVVTVGSSATLAGIGTVGGALTINGMVAPGGNAIGTLKTVGETWNGGGSYQFTLNNATNSAGWDLLSITGSLNIQSSASNAFTIKVVSLTSSNTPGPIDGFVSGGTNVWTLTTASGGIQNFNASNFIVDATAFSNSYTGTFTLGTNGNALILTYTGSSGSSSNGTGLQPPVINQISNVTGGAFGFTFSGQQSQNYRVLATTNLALPMLSWMLVTNGVFGAVPINYSEMSTGNVQKFYRVASP